MVNEEYSPFLGERFATRDGVKIYFQRGGPRGGTPIIFCYGLVCAWSQFKYQLGPLSKNHDLIWWDFRGHHASDDPPDETSYTVDHFTCDLIDLMNHCEIKKAIVVGHSMGGCVALQAAIKYPQRVAGVVSIGTPLRNPLDSMFFTNLTETVFRGIQLADLRQPQNLERVFKWFGQNRQVAWLFQVLGFNKQKSELEDVQEYLRKAAAVGPHIFVLLMEHLRGLNLLPSLPKIKCPVLVIQGENDLIVPMEHAEYLLHLCPQTDLMMVPGGSHVPQFNEPKLVTNSIDQFVAGLRRQKRTQV